MLNGSPPKEHAVATDPNEHRPQSPRDLPATAGRLATSTEIPSLPPQPQLPQSSSRDYAGEVEDEDGDPVRTASQDVNAAGIPPSPPHAGFFISGIAGPPAPALAAQSPL